jgi:hypothetical protein
MLLVASALLLPAATVPAARAERPRMPLRAPRLGPFLAIWSDLRADHSPAVAHNSRHDEYLVVWVEKQGAFTWDIWARRVRADGTLLSSFNVFSMPGWKLYEPAVAYNPDRDEYLVVFTHEYSPHDYDIWARRILWDQPGNYAAYHLDISYMMQFSPAVVYNPAQHEYLVGYTSQSAADNTRIRLWRISATDGLLAFKYVGSPMSKDYRQDPALAYNPQRNNYLLTYTHEWRDMLNWHYDLDAQLQQGDLGGAYPEVAIATGVDMLHYMIQYPAVAYAPGQHFLVSWTRGTGPMNVYARRVGSDGVPRGPAGGFLVTGCSGFTYCRNSHLAYAPAFGFLVTWEFFDVSTPDVANVYGRLVHPGQDAPDGTNFAVDASANFQGFADVACASTSPRSACLVVEEHCTTAGIICSFPDIRGRLVYPWLTDLPVVTK